MCTLGYWRQCSDGQRASFLVEMRKNIIIYVSRQTRSSRPVLDNDDSKISVKVGRLTVVVTVTDCGFVYRQAFQYGWVFVTVLLFIYCIPDACICGLDCEFGTFLSTRIGVNDGQ